MFNHKRVTARINELRREYAEATKNEPAERLPFYFIDPMKGPIWLGILCLPLMLADVAFCYLTGRLR